MLRSLMTVNRVLIIRISIIGMETMAVGSGRR